MVLSHTCGCMKDHRVLEVTVASNLKLGKEWRFRRSVIDRWLDQQMLSEDSGFSHMREGNELE